MKTTKSLRPGRQAFFRFSTSKGEQRSKIALLALIAGLGFGVILPVHLATAQVAGGPVQTKESATASPRIDFGSTTFDFGRARSGDTIKHVFVFTNTGAATLEVTDVKTSCGCTTAGTWDKVVEPGKTGIIPLQFNSSGFGGQVAKTATITCNDPARTNLLLQLTGTIWKPIDVIPQMAVFNVSSEVPTNETKVLKLMSNLDEPVVLSDLHCSNPSFKTDLKETKLGKEFELSITVLPPFNSQSIFSTITLKSSSTNAPSLSISAYAIVQQAVSITPQQVTLAAGPLKSPLTLPILVQNNSTNRLALSDVRLDLPGVELKVTESQSNRLFSIGVTFPAGFEVPTGQMPVLTMKSSHPKFPELKVPIVQLRTSGPGSTPGIPAPGQLRTASVQGSTP